MELSDSMYSYRYEFPAAKVIDRCKNCGNDIYEHQKYWDVFGTIICEECIDDFSVED